jgi:hypothetical protein
VLDRDPRKDRLRGDDDLQTQFQCGLHCSSGSLGRAAPVTERWESLAVEGLEHLPRAVEIDVRVSEEVGVEDFAVGPPRVGSLHRLCRDQDRAHDVSVGEVALDDGSEGLEVPAEEQAEVDIEQRSVQVEENSSHASAFLVFDRA